MKTFNTLYEEINKEEKDLSVDDAGLIQVVTERIKEIVSGAKDMSPEEIVDELSLAISTFNLTFDKDKALKALESDEPVELPLTIADSEDDPFSLNAEDDETGEEIPGEMVLALNKDGDGIAAKINVYFDDPEPESLDDLEFHIPDEDESDEEKEKEKQEEGSYEGYPSDEEEDVYKEKSDGETRPVGGKVNQMGGVEEEDDDEDECTCDDKENCTCGAKEKKKEDSDVPEGGGEHQSRVSSGGSQITRKGAVEVYESKFYEMHSSKYACVHIKNNKLRVEIIDHPLDAYHKGLAVVGQMMEIKPHQVHETVARMHRLKKEDQAVERAKKKKIEEKMLKDSTIESPVATGKKSPVINDIMNKDDQKKFKEKMEVKKEESLPASNTQVVNIKKLKEKKGKELPEPGTYQI